MQRCLSRGRPAQGAGPLRHRERLAGAPRPAGAARAQGVRPRRRLHRQGRQGHHHRRVHRPDDGGPALLGRAASGARGQGAGRDPGREPDPGLDHLPELFPPLQEARRHDRHGRDRGRRVRRDLPAGRDRDPDPPRDGPQGRGRRGLPHRAREERRDHRGDDQSAHAKGQPILVGTVSIEKSEHAVRPAQGQGPDRIRCSTPATTSRKPTSSPRPGGWAR